MTPVNPANLFVTNFSWGKTEDDMRELFSPYGELASVKLITDRETGRSRGFGFVEFVNAEDAANACADVDNGGLNGAEVDGRAIAVVVAKPREERPAYAPRNNYAA